MKQKTNFKRAIPNFFTFGNMFCGFLSVVYALDKEFGTAAWLIGVAALSDALDGLAARLTKTSSQFGVELDSIADVVSFGLAPAFLLYQYELHRYPVTGVLVSSLFLMAGGFRLARFNSELVGYSKEYFKGLPIPVAAATVGSYVIYASHAGGLYPLFQYFPAVLSVVLSALMASRVKYMTFPSFSFRSMKKNPVFFSLLTISIIAAVYTSGAAIFWVFSCFILFGILNHIINYIKGK